MGVFLLPEEFDTDEGRRGAWRSLWLHDHGFIRKVHGNVRPIDEQMYRSAQPSPQDVKEWADKGLKTIINLRGLRNNVRQPGFWHLEREACEQAGIAMIDLRAYSREAPKPEFLVEIDKLFQDIQYPALMHCKSGADRAGLGGFLYRFLKLEEPIDVAREQLSLKYGHIKSGKTGVLDHFIDTYAAVAKYDGVEPGRQHFLEWVRTEYDRDAIKASFKPQALGTFLTDTLLRRE
ncbi:MAG: tyrosine-protein phosphatase [Parvularculaceae bacterium]|nr:tyrosine-protein phosphatase [Parvularculaceae bacterium]